MGAQTTQQSSDLIFRGRCWKFGDHVPTDEMAEFFHRENSGVLAGLNPRFPLEVKPGDLIVGGIHFGQSSGRSLAAKALQLVGVTCIAVESAARTFQRNCYELGLPILECPDVTSLVEEGDVIEVDVEQGIVKNITRGGQVRAEKTDPFVCDMLRAGGMINFVRARPELWHE